MFMGEYQNSIDAKSRIIIPSKFRDELGYKVVVAKGQEHCLYIYSMEEWKKEWERSNEELSRLSTGKQDARAFVRFFFSSGEECEMDKQGRITIPTKMKGYASIDKETITIGVMNRIEIWGKKKWEEYNEEVSQKLDDISVHLPSIGF